MLCTHYLARRVSEEVVVFEELNCVHVVITARGHNIPGRGREGGGGGRKEERKKGRNDTWM
jgi:hypothetical protein